MGINLNKKSDAELLSEMNKNFGKKLISRQEEDEGLKKGVKLISKPNKKTKEDPKEKKYNEILNNPKISEKAKGHLRRNTENGKKLNMDDLRAFEENELLLTENWSDEEEEPVKKRGRPKKVYKEANIMKGRSDLKKKGDKYTVDTELNIKKGLEPKVKRALKKSVETELDKKIKGEGLRKIKLDFSDDEKPKRGKGIYSDSSSDEEDIKEYGKLLKHLISHISDPKEKIDKKDFKQSIELIKKIKSKKA